MFILNINYVSFLFFWNHIIYNEIGSWYYFIFTEKFEKLLCSLQLFHFVDISLWPFFKAGRLFTSLIFCIKVLFTRCKLALIFILIFLFMLYFKFFNKSLNIFFISTL